MDITNLIETTLRSISKTRGSGFANLYLKYSKQVNFSIVLLVGLLFYSLAGSVAPGLLGALVQFALLWVWLWVNLLGPLAPMWGFYTTKIVEKVKAKPEVWRKAVKKQVVEYRKADDYLVREADGSERKATEKEIAELIGGE